MPGKFRTTIKGYNINEVNSFVDKVTAEYEALLEKFSTDGNISISPDNIFTILDKEWDERTHVYS